jgi:hypothetical protein
MSDKSRLLGENMIDKSHRVSTYPTQNCNANLHVLSQYNQADAIFCFFINYSCKIEEANAPLVSRISFIRSILWVNFFIKNWMKVVLDLKVQRIV